LRINQTIYLALLILASCNNASNQEAINSVSNEFVANQFVDAFYSFDRDSLESVLSLAKESHPSILYYQKWAECGNYKIVKRGGIIQKNDSVLLVPVTVKDDLMGALKIDFNVTDTFHLSMQNGKIRSLQTSSNDPDEYYKAKDWVKQNRPELIEKACEGIWEGGPTPCECILGLIKGFTEFTAQKN
jgi:hypothetical protein